MSTHTISGGTGIFKNSVGTIAATFHQYLPKSTSNETDHSVIKNHVLVTGHICTDDTVEEEYENLQLEEVM